jgi:hypothetical protein
MRDLKIATSTILILAALGGAVGSPGKRWPPPSPSLELNKYDQEIFDVAMQLGDWSWEPSTGYIEANDDGVSRFLQSRQQVLNPCQGHTSTRFTAWYAPGLLYRNKGDDLDNAIWAIKNM